MSADLKEFRFSPFRRGNEGLACACQDAARRTPFDQLGFQFPLEGGELPRHGRMVHAKASGSSKNLTGAGDLQEYADTIPIHRLQFSHTGDSSRRCADFNISYRTFGNKELRRLRPYRRSAPGEAGVGTAAMSGFCATGAPPARRTYFACW